MSPWFITLSLLACGGPPTPPAPAEAPVVQAADTDADAPRPVLEVVDSDAEQAAEPAQAPRAFVRPAGLPEGTPYTVVLAILGGVGAARSPVCDLPLALTPVLAGLRDDHGAVVGCRTYAPSSWTVPSLRSILSGSNVYLPQGPATEPLARAMRAQGYQTAFLSADPTLADSPLTQGFDLVRVAEDPRGLRHPRVGPAIQTVTSRADAAKPLFLVVHLQDGADPYPPVPHRSWGLAQGWFTLSDRQGRPNSMWRQYHSEHLALDEEHRMLLRLDQGLNRGVEISDASLGDLLSALDAQGRPLSDMRLVVVGDRGGFAGEHRLIGEASATWEEGVRVPLVFLDPDAEAPDLSGPLSSVVAYHLTRDGRLPNPLPAVVSTARTLKGEASPGSTMVSVWTDARTKHTWVDGAWSVYDLVADPEEASPKPPGTVPPEGLAVVGRLQSIQAETP